MKATPPIYSLVEEEVPYFAVYNIIKCTKDTQNYDEILIFTVIDVQRLGIISN
jgi:hypothetical protein